MLQFFCATPCLVLAVKLCMGWIPIKKLFVEKGMIGGISYIAKRDSKANNKFIFQILYYINIYFPSKYIIYLDSIKLCGSAMSQYLPYS